MFTCICSYFWVDRNLPKTEFWKTFANFCESSTYAFFPKIDHVKIFPFPTTTSASHRPIGTEENPQHTKMQVHWYISTAITRNNWSFPFHANISTSRYVKNTSNSAGETKITKTKTHNHQRTETPSHKWINILQTSSLPQTITLGLRRDLPKYLHYKTQMDIRTSGSNTT